MEGQHKKESDREQTLACPNIGMGVRHVHICIVQRLHGVKAASQLGSGTTMPLRVHTNTDHTRTKGRPYLPAGTSNLQHIARDSLILLPTRDRRFILLLARRIETIRIPRIVHPIQRHTPAHLLTIHISLYPYESISLRHEAS